MLFDSKIVVGVLRGGPSSEYEVSIKTGENIINSLPSSKYTPRDILIAKDGVWHIDGRSRKPAIALRHVDVVWNAMHGEFGEDGKIQQILETIGIPYTGSEVYPSMIAMNKIMTKEHVEASGIKTAPYMVIRKTGKTLEDAILTAFRKISMPVVVKPATLGSSVGIAVARDFISFRAAIRKAMTFSDSVLVEEFIKGREATCGVVDNFRGKEIYPLLPVEIRIPESSPFFDYKAKYTGISQEICPGLFDPKDIIEIQKLAVAAHKILGLRHYSRSDFIVTPNRGIYFLETNTLPGFTSESLFPKSLRAVGSDVPEFLDHILTLALNKK